jgi:cell division protein FtsW (lipid II flippase)
VSAATGRLSLRNRELLNLVVVGILIGIGFGSVYIAKKAQISSASLSYAAIFLGLYVFAHVVARIAVPYADPYLLPIAGLLTAIGVTEIYNLRSDDAFRQGMWVVFGVVLFALTLLALRWDYRALENYKYLFGVTAIVLLVLPALPAIGSTVNGARLWVHLGPLSFQPGEVAKIMMTIFLAGYLRDKREVLAQGRLKDFGPLLVIWGGAMLVLLETNDLGSGLLYFGVFLAMVYVATARLAYVVAGGLLFAGGAFAVYHAVSRVRERVDIWLDPWPHAHTSGYQLIQSSYSIANGHIGGTGIGRGTFTTTGGNQLIPYLNTASALLMLYMVFVIRGFRAALLIDDGFSKLLAAGLTFSFALQTFIIVGGIVRLIPLTGITLPFVSYGGSSVVANFILLALLLLVSNRANRERT